jgi:putative FmdB family regulatory protein
MPTYGFRCPEGHEFDRFYKTISSAPGTLECPECGKSAARQIHGGAGLAFKGSGFYLTDYGKNAHRSDSKPADTKSDKPSDTKADTKPKSDAPKSESKAAPAPKPKAE